MLLTHCFEMHACIYILLNKLVIFLCTGTKIGKFWGKKYLHIMLYNIMKSSALGKQDLMQ